MTRYLREKREGEGKQVLLDIPNWDERDRISEFATRIHSSLLSHAQIEELLKEWYSKLFQRLYNPKVDNTCLILLGNQGIGKDVLIKAFTSGLGQFAIPFQNQGQQKDILQALHSGIAVHIEEFDHIAEKLPEAFLKMLITTSQTLFRAAFGKTQELREARWSLIASCNRDDFLRDHTGNRRFIIIPIDRIDGIHSATGEVLAYPHGLINFPADEGLQILAQAKLLASKAYVATNDTKLVASSYVERLTPVNLEKEFFQDFLEYCANHSRSLQLVKGVYFLSTAEHQDQITQISRRYGLVQGWSKVKAILAKSGVDANARTRHVRGLGVPPELLRDFLSHDTSDAVTTEN